MAEEHVDIIIKQTVTESIAVDPELRSKIAAFTDYMLDEAKRTMRFGLSAERMQLMKMVLGPAVKSVGQDVTRTENEGRLALENIFQSMREGSAPTHAVTPVASLAPRVDDPDQGVDDRTIPDRQ